MPILNRVVRSNVLPDGNRVIVRTSSRMKYRCPTSIADKVVDLSFAEQGNPIVLGVRLVGHTDYRSPHIQAACIGVLNYADESKRTVDSLLQYG